MSSIVGVVIRDATSTDARAIAEVHVASWRWAYRDDLPVEFLDGLSVDDREREWNEWLAPDQPGAGTLVAEEPDRIAGASTRPPAGRGTARRATTDSTARTSRSSGTG